MSMQKNYQREPSAGVSSVVAAFLNSGEIADPQIVRKLSAYIGEKAPDLAAILRSSPVRTQIDAYYRFDASAVKQQLCFTRDVTMANLCLMGAGVLSGAAILAEKVDTPSVISWIPNVQFALGAAIIACGALATLLTFKTRNTDRIERWLTQRSSAEVARIMAFQAIANQAAAKGQIVAAQALSLIKHCLLDHQSQWLSRRARRHRDSADRTAIWGGLAAALAYVAGSGAIVASFAPDQTWLVFAGVVGAAMASYAANRENLRQDRANADRYEKSVIALDALAERFDAVGDEIAAGAAEAVVVYTNAIADQLSAEHAQWLDGATQAQNAVATLDDALRKVNQTASANSDDDSPALR